MHHPSYNQLHCTYRKVVVRILKRRIDKKVEDVLGDQFGFRRGKGTRNSIGMLHIISEQTLDVDEGL